MRKFTFIIFVFAMMGFAQAQTAQFNYVSPVPGSKYVNPEQTIALRHGEIIDLTSIRFDLISVYGSLRVELPGIIQLAGDHKTVIFIPASPFNFGEKITVEVKAGLKTESGLILEGFSFDFQIKEYDNYPMLLDFYQRKEKLETSDFINQEEYLNPSKNAIKSASEEYPDGFPIPTIAEFADPSPGYVFCGPRPMATPDYDPYILIMDNYGTPVFYRKTPRRANDFKTLVNNQLTYCDFDNSNPVINKYLLMDSKFEYTDSLTMGNGYVLDQHDILMYENGDHFLMAYDPQLVNMDTVVPGGDTAATVTGFVIQKLDADHNVIFQWRSWDHFEITDANHTDFTAPTIDYVHGNAFDIDNDGNLLMSMRNMEEITKIDLETGEIIWRFGLHAKNNMFTFTNDTTGFSWQHDIRRIANGNVTVYDNGNYHTPNFSQALEYELDEVNFTAELVWNYIHDPVVYGRATGAHRRLENNNAFICWGLTWPINVSEVTHDGMLAWELHWPLNVWEYRSFKFDWETDYFETSTQMIDFGEYDDYVPWPRVFSITNNSDDEIQITSTHNHWESYSITTELPLSIPAGESKNMTVNFFPTMQGQIDDVLTIIYDSFYNDTMPQRIARQIHLTGSVADSHAPIASFDPEDGSEDILQDSKVIITFDEPVVKADGSPVRASDLENLIAFQEAGGEDVPFTATIDVLKTTFTLSPDTLKPLTEYMLEIKGNNLSDNSGNIITDPVTSSFTTISEQGIDEPFKDYISVFPNPTKDNIFINISDYTPKRLRIINVQGQTIMHMDSQLDQSIVVDLNHLVDGIYFILIEFNETIEVFEQKVIKK